MGQCDLSSGFGFEAFTVIAPCSLFPSSASVSVDLYNADSSCELKSHPDGFEIQTGFFNFVDFVAFESPQLVSRAHSAYFFCIPSENKATFSLNYTDPYGNTPSLGYPLVCYWKDGSAQKITLTLDFKNSTNGALQYSKEADLTPGLYWYYYSATNAQYPGTYDLVASSFAITERPIGFVNNGLSDNAFVSNGLLTLKWLAQDPEGSNVTYRLFFGKDSSSLSQIYEGPLTEFTLKSLDYGTQYFWQVEAIDNYGASSLSKKYSFTTIATIKRSFNYPNPFNPSTDKTHIVIDMPQNGSASISVYSEFGDLVWQRTLDNLPSGINEIEYDGTDDFGSVLYNGSYVCVIKKLYGSKEDKDTCRLLIMK